MGCGSGRWAKFIAPKVKVLNCIEPSDKALKIAKQNLKNFKNCKFENNNVMDNSIQDSSQDFGYCLGVLHHIPDTKLGLISCVKKLKKGAPFLIYLYYRFDNKPFWYRFIWSSSDIIRRLISKLPFNLKIILTTLIALIVYYPLSKLALFLESFKFNINNLPLSSYRKTSFYTMKTDALDRFGTRLEKRYTKDEIFNMMKEAGLRNIIFSENAPYWVAVGEKN